ncbi:Putative RNA polymerase II regulator [Phaffia rhodozyma]|uniref:Putative RNA polymerase II regulator n=1 Tax=Phaffia rhodozyma TaxID=264483 RepID=A0A0F7SWV1_PHARH|nr:Putative RNA polymerase II regulator [Phaffia rhodozyma]
MSSKKIDLLVRVRYENPLPPPPFPPKLLDIPTSISRYARPSFTSNLAKAIPLPMMVDAECGMPLNLLGYPAIWEGDMSQLNPKALHPSLHPSDAYLLTAPTPDNLPVDPSSASSSKLVANGSSSTTITGGLKPEAHGHVGWLRPTEYIQNETKKARSSAANGLKQLKRPENLDRSIEGQWKLIESSFEELEKSKLEDMRFPGKPHLRAEESFDFLPDPQSWYNGYSLFRFQEAPGKELSDPDRVDEDLALSSAIFRPVLLDDETTLVYYLPDSEEVGRKAVEGMVDRGETGPSTDESYKYNLTRKYEVVDQQLRQATELGFILCTDNSSTEDQAENGTGGKRKRSKGAYYHEYHSRTVLKKKRANKDPQAQDDQEWDEIHLTLHNPTAESLEERQETNSFLVDPDWAIKTKEAQLRAAQAEAEAEVGGDAQAQTGSGRMDRVSDRDAEGEAEAESEEETGANE